MRRSKHTNYVTAHTQIFEFKQTYFVLEECQQGQFLNPAHGTFQHVSDFSGLSAKFSDDYTHNEMGLAVIKALDNFDCTAHPFDEYDFPARNKAICGWVGARGMGGLEKNVREVQIIQSLSDQSTAVIPFDNNNRDNWNGPMEDCIIQLPPGSPAEQIGEAVRQAFKLATYHPERKDPKVGE